MRTFNAVKMRSLSRKLFALSLTALLLTSCGSDSSKNETSSSSSNSDSNSSPIFGDPNIGGGGNTGSIWSQLKSQTSCPQGRMSDITFKTQQVYGNSYSISSNLQTGSVSGNVQGTYFGQNSQGDLMFVSKVSTGSGNAYNVVVSLCIFRDSYAEYIGPNANMSNYYIQNVVLNNNTSASNGTVTSGVFGFTSPAWGGVVPLQFAGANINNQYPTY